MSHLLAIDQGTTSTRAFLFDATLSPVGNSAEEFRKVIKDDLQTFGEIVAKMK